MNLLSREGGENDDFCSGLTEFNLLQHLETVFIVYFTICENQIVGRFPCLVQCFLGRSRDIDLVALLGKQLIQRPADELILIDD